MGRAEVGEGVRVGQEDGGRIFAPGHLVYDLQGQALLSNRDALGEVAAHGHQLVGQDQQFQGGGGSEFQIAHVVDDVAAGLHGRGDGEHGLGSGLGVKGLGVRGPGKGPDGQSVYLVPHLGQGGLGQAPLRATVGNHGGLHVQHADIGGEEEGLHQGW